MKDKKFLLNSILVIVLGVALLVCAIVRILIPAAVFPKLDIPMIAGLSLITLVIDHYLASGAKRCYPCVFILGALTFGLLPYASAFASLDEMWKLALTGGIVFGATTWIYSSIQDRLSSGAEAKLAPIMSAFGLYLAFQCFAGIIL